MNTLTKPVPGLGAVTIVVNLDEFHKPALTERQQQLVRELFPKTWARGYWAKGRISNDIKEEMLDTARQEMPEALKQIEALLAGIYFEFRVKIQEGQPPEKEGEPTKE